MVSTLGAARAAPSPAARRRAPHQQPNQQQRLHHALRPTTILRGSSRSRSSGDAVRAHASSASSSSSDWLVPDGLVRALDPPPPRRGHDDDDDDESAPPPPPPAAAFGDDDTGANNNSAKNADNLTVYTLRLTTSAARNAGASDPASSVQVLLLGRDGRAVLRRVAPLYDPSDAERAARHICDVVGSGEGVGADCSRFIAAEEEEQQQRPPAPTPPRPAPPGPIRARFQRGAVDEVSFLAPDLGHPLAAMIVAPESGTWSLDEATVNSSRTGRGDRFVCRRLLGSGAPGAARAAERRSRGNSGGGSGPGPAASPAYLTPVPAGAVVVGEGAAQKALSRAEADALRERGMEDYSRLKGRVTAATALLGALGSVAAGALGGSDAAAPFALGGLAGLGYWALLQLGVAAALPAAGGPAAAAGAGAEEESGGGSGGGDEAPPAPAAARPTGSPLIRFLGSAPFRVAAVGAVAVVAASAARWSAAPDGNGGGGVAPPSGQVAAAHASLRPWQLGLAAAGFLTYKVAVVGVGALGLGEEGGEDDDEGGGGKGGRGSGGPDGGRNKQPAAAATLSSRDLEATRAMRAPSPTSQAEGEDEDADD